MNTDLPGLDRLLNHKQRLRKLWHETRDPACKTAVNWVVKTIRRMTRKKELERWETRIANCEATPQALWPIAKSLLKRDGPKAPTAIQALNFIRYRKPILLLIALKICSHPTACVTKTMNGGWRLQSKLCSKP
jgi:hypothetical protein